MFRLIGPSSGQFINHTKPVLSTLLHILFFYVILRPKMSYFSALLCKLKGMEIYTKGTVITLSLYQHLAKSILRTHPEMPRCSSGHTPLQAHSPWHYVHEPSERSLLSPGIKNHPCHLRSSPPEQHPQQCSQRNLHP